MPRGITNDGRLNTAAPAALVRKVDRAAKERAETRSQWVRRACIEQLKREKE